MQYIDNKAINEYTDMIFEFPALQSMDNLTKNNLKEIFQQFFKELYINKLESIQKYLQFRADNKIADQIFKDYGIDKNIINNINPVFKKTLVYFLEKLFQEKGSISVLKIFNQIFETLFSGINFYKIIVVKQPVTKKEKEIKKISYRLTYALEPLYINVPDNVLTTLDSPVSLTGKFLMDLNQFKDFKIFPANTNLIYMQFTSTEINLDNLKTFSTGVKAYAITSLQNNIIPFRNFYNEFFDLDAGDIMDVLFYMEMHRKRMFKSNFDFQLDKDKEYLSLRMDKNNLFELEKFLHEYKTLNYHNRKEMSSFKRRWNLFKKNFYTTEREYTNYNELERYINDNYPEIINIIHHSLTKDNDYVQFYIDFYLKVLPNININNYYINIFINSLFLSIITGEAFVQHFFLPVYKIFQKYFFPIEMDFLTKIIQTFIIRDKFESVFYDQQIEMEMTTKAMSKHYLKPDKISIFLTRSISDSLNSKDVFKCWINTSFKENKKIYNRDDIIYLNINSFQKDKIIFLNKESIIINSFQKDKIKLEKEINILINSINKDLNVFKDKSSMQIGISNSTKQKINENTSSIITTKYAKKLKFANKFSSEIDRYNYTQKYDSLKLYLTFEDLNVKTKTSNLTNSSFKYDRMDDQIYFSIHKIF